MCLKSLIFDAHFIQIMLIFYNYGNVPFSTDVLDSSSMWIPLIVSERADLVVFVLARNTTAMAVG